MSSSSGVISTFESNTVVAGGNVQLHIGNVITNVFQGSEGAALSGVKPQPNESPNESDNILPPRPVHVLERDAHHERIVNALISSPNTRVAILGMGGIGKTTLAASIMWDNRIREAYPRQYFMSFEGLSTPELAYSSLANTFDIPIDSRKSHTQVMGWILRYLGQKLTLICIDNFETFWEISENRREADDFLAQLASLPDLAILVTLRGVQRPVKVRWLRTDPLDPLSLDGSIELVQQITPDDFGDAAQASIRDILEAVAGIPLAVTLVANLLADGAESPHSLLRRWNVESTRAIGMDVEDRQYQLDVSLKLSVFGPRMSDDARAVLAAIALLPAGLSSEAAWLDEYQSFLPITLDIRGCLRALSNTALCSLDKTASSPRHQLLSPVRQFCTRHLTFDLPAVHDLIDLYISIIGAYTGFGSQPRYTWFTNELTNITAILNFALSLPNITDSLAYACSTYTLWMDYLGSPTIDIIRKATKTQPEWSKGKAKCLHTHGYVMRLRGQYEEAKSLLQQALAIHRDVGDRLEEARDLMELGDIYRSLERLEDAEDALTKALELHQGQEDRTGEADCLRALADVYDDMDRFSEAESFANDSIDLYRSTGNRLGEANGLNALGWVHRRQGKFENAIETVNEAYEICKEIKHTQGQALAKRSLGLAHEANGDLDQAASCLRESIRLYEKCSALEDAQWVTEDLSEVLSKLNSEAEVTKMNSD